MWMWNNIFCLNLIIIFKINKKFNMNNIHDPDFKRHVFEKRESFNEHISVYSGIRNQFGIISRYIYLTLDNGDIIGSFAPYLMDSK